jgi:hypothetical protein
MVTLPPLLVSTDFGTCSYQCFLSNFTPVSLHMLKCSCALTLSCLSIYYPLANLLLLLLLLLLTTINISVPGSSVGIATVYGLDGPGSNSGGARFSACPDWPWGPPSLLYNGYRVFPGVKILLGRAVDHSLPSNAAVKKMCSYTSTHPQGHLVL